MSADKIDLDLWEQELNKPIQFRDGLTARDATIVTALNERAVKLIGWLKDIKKITNAQSESEAIWSFPLCECGQIDCPRTPKERIDEALLKQSLRQLHKVIEQDITGKDVDRLISEFYEC